MRCAHTKFNKCGQTGTAAFSHSHVPLMPKINEDGNANWSPQVSEKASCHRGMPKIQAQRWRLGTPSVPRRNFPPEERGLCSGPELIFATLCMKTAQCNRKVCLHTYMLTSVGQSAFVLMPSSPPQLPHPQADAKTPTQANTYVLAPLGDQGTLLWCHCSAGTWPFTRLGKLPLSALFLPHKLQLTRTRDRRAIHDIYTNNMDLAPALGKTHAMMVQWSHFLLTLSPL